MSKQEEQFRPYAAASNIIEVINRARTRNLPEIINNDFLRITGVPELAWSRVMQALRFLSLVHEDGRPSDTFEAIAGATDSQYRELLEKVIRDSYRVEFDRIDPGLDPQPKIIDAFQPYKPRSQTNRMVMLFLALCREAGIPVLDVPRERRMKEATPKRQLKNTTRRSTVSSEKPRRQITEPGVSPTTPLLFGVTEDDIGALSEDEFEEVWSALGKVARARARTKEEPVQQDTIPIEDENEEEKE